MGAPIGDTHSPQSMVFMKTISVQIAVCDALFIEGLVRFCCSVRYCVKERKCKLTRKLCSPYGATLFDVDKDRKGSDYSLISLQLILVLLF